jgi:3-oxoadipate enol-lactonase
MQRRTVAIPVGELAVAEAGTGGRPFLLVHGFTGAKEDFTDWLDPLADRGWHAVAVDLRGHGASAKPVDESAYSLAAFAGDVVDLADALGWSRFTLLGHSMGGMVAQVVAVDHAERLDALVLMDTTHRSVDVDPAQAQLAVDIVRSGGLGALADLLAGADGPLTTDADRRVRRERPGYAALGDAKFRACSPAMYASMVPQLLDQEDRARRLAGVQVPTLVVVGEQDPFLAPSVEIAGAIPGADLVVVAGAGHSPQFEAPEAWWDALVAFTDRVAAVAEVR